MAVVCTDLGELADLLGQFDTTEAGGVPVTTWVARRIDNSSELADALR